MAYYCFINCHILPHDFNNLPIREKALICAMINIKAESEKEAMKKMNKVH